MFLKMEINPNVYAHAKNLYVRAIFSHRGNFCAIIEAEKKKEVKTDFLNRGGMCKKKFLQAKK